DRVSYGVRRERKRPRVDRLEPGPPASVGTRARLGRRMDALGALAGAARADPLAGQRGSAPEVAGRLLLRPDRRVLAQPSLRLDLARLLHDHLPPPLARGADTVPAGPPGDRGRLLHPPAARRRSAALVSGRAGDGTRDPRLPARHVSLRVAALRGAEPLS